MSASRAGRNAEPTSWVFFTEISVLMISPRSISSACISASMRSISLRRSCSEGALDCGAVAGGFDMVGLRIKDLRAPGAPQTEAALIGKTGGESKENIDDFAGQALAPVWLTVALS